MRMHRVCPIPQLQKFYKMALRQQQTHTFVQGCFMGFAYKKPLFSVFKSNSPKGFEGAAFLFCTNHISLWYSSSALVLKG